MNINWLQSSLFEKSLAIFMIDKLKARLQLALPGTAAQERMSSRVYAMPETLPEDHRLSAVLCLIVSQEAPSIILIRRAEDGGSHSGQIAFPGGRFEPSDVSLSATALRETFEELGIAPQDISLLGALSPMYIPVSRFLVHPFIGYLPNWPLLQPNAAEVSEVLRMPLAYLLDPQRKQRKIVTPAAFPHLRIDAPIYVLDGEDYIWGATAMMLSELEVVMGEVLQ